MPTQSGRLFYLIKSAEIGKRGDEEWLDATGSLKLSGGPYRKRIGKFRGKYRLVGEAESSSWSKRQRRAFHRLMTCQTYWSAQGYAMMRLDLTTAPGGDSLRLAIDARELRRRMEHYLLQPQQAANLPHVKRPSIQHIAMRTTEGHGVLHLILAYKAAAGMRETPFYVPQALISRWWAEIHGAPVVWVRRLHSGEGKRAARYLVSQYLSGGQSALARLSWS